MEHTERTRPTVHSCFPTCAIQSWIHCLQLCVGGAHCNSAIARCQERQTTSNADGCFCFRSLFAGCWQVITYKDVVYMHLVGEEGAMCA